jgi:hypothetical protein
MKRLLFIVALGISGLASAGQLDDANSLLRAKSYEKALPLYAQLADAGNAEAQFRLGEMYWYGDGTQPDLKMATAWMQKAAAQGHAGAKESLAIIKERETRMADIAYWTSGYQGKDLVSGRFNCIAPVIPSESATADEIRSTAKGYGAWQACYDGFAANLHSLMPPVKRIPADVLRLMTPREGEQAVTHLNMVFDGIIAQANQTALAVSSRYVLWETRTQTRIADLNLSGKLEYEILRQRHDERQVQIYQNARQIPVTPVVTQPAPAGK